MRNIPQEIRENSERKCRRRKKKNLNLFLFRSRAQFQDELESLNPDWHKEIKQNLDSIRPDGDVDLKNENFESFLLPKCTCGCEFVYKPGNFYFPVFFFYFVRFFFFL